MFVDHLIEYNGCNHEDHFKTYGPQDISMAEFVEDRLSTMESVRELGRPDFANNDRLPPRNRTYYEDEPNEYDVEDLSTQLEGAPLSHMSASRWSETCEDTEKLFVGAPTSIPGQTGLPNLEVGKDCDISTSEDAEKRAKSQGELTLDIDSILALFTDLSAIQTSINIYANSNPAKNLNSTVHLSHQNHPVHHIPQFFIGTLGDSPEYQLYMLLPRLFKKNVRRTKGNLHNHVPERVIELFMDTCFLPAVQETLPPRESQAWHFSFALVKANSKASIKEGNAYKIPGGRVGQQISYRLAKEHIPKVWKKCQRYLRTFIEQDPEYAVFKGYQFFVTGKNFKDLLHAENWPQLMKTCRKEVQPIFLYQLTLV